MEFFHRFFINVAQLLHKLNIWIVFPALLVVVLLEVCLRTFFSVSVSWSQEVLGLLLLCAVFLSLPICVGRRDLLSVDLLSRYLSPRLRIGVVFLRQVLILGAFCLIVWQGLASLQDMLEYDERSYVLDLPLWPFVGLLVGVGLLCCLLVLFSVHIESEVSVMSSYGTD